MAFSSIPPQLLRQHRKENDFGLKRARTRQVLRGYKRPTEPGGERRGYFTHIEDEALETAVKDTPNLCASRFEPPRLLPSVAATSAWKGVEYSRRPVARAALFLIITLSLFAATVLGQANGTV